MEIGMVRLVHWRAVARPASAAMIVDVYSMFVQCTTKTLHSRLVATTLTLYLRIYMTKYCLDFNYNFEMGLQVGQAVARQQKTRHLECPICMFYLVAAIASAEEFLV